MGGEITQAIADQRQFHADGWDFKLTKAEITDGDRDMAAVVVAVIAANRDKIVEVVEAAIPKRFTEEWIYLGDCVADAVIDLIGED